MNIRHTVSENRDYRVSTYNMPCMNIFECLVFKYMFLISKEIYLHDGWGNSFLIFLNRPPPIFYLLITNDCS